MDCKLFDSELKVMEILWNGGDMTAGQLAKVLAGQVGWNRNTTYTVIKKLLGKGAIERVEPNYVCRALIARGQVQQQEASSLIGKLFDGSAEQFLSAYFSGNKLSGEEIARLKRLIDRLE